MKDKLLQFQGQWGAEQGRFFVENEEIGRLLVGLEEVDLFKQGSLKYLLTVKTHENKVQRIDLTPEELEELPKDERMMLVYTREVNLVVYPSKEKWHKLFTQNKSKATVLTEFRHALKGKTTVGRIMDDGTELSNEFEFNMNPMYVGALETQSVKKGTWGGMMLTFEAHLTDLGGDKNTFVREVLKAMGLEEKHGDRFVNKDESEEV